MADSLERLSTHPLDLEAGLQPTESGKRGNAVLGEMVGLASAKASDEDEVVVVSEPLFALVAEVSETTVIARPGIGLGRRVERL